jgi:hypothetical protein
MPMPSAARLSWLQVARTSLAQPEIRQVHVVGTPRLRVEQHVGRLDVAMHQPGRQQKEMRSVVKSGFQRVRTTSTWGFTASRAG